MVEYLSSDQPTPPSTLPPSHIPIKTKAHPTSSSVKNLSTKEIFRIALLLRRVLIPDLVPQILEYANIFSISTFCKQSDLKVTRDQSPRMCLLTPPIRSRVRKEHPVVKVSFRIKARDEGLALGIGKSYFTAAVLRGTALRQGELSDYLNALDGAALGSRRVVCTNTTASDVYDTHLVDFRRDASDCEEAAWVADLRPGDRIVVNAHAQWASFSNHIAEVEVQVHTVAMVR